MANALNIDFIKKFTGYKAYRDVTNLMRTDFTSGSQNFFIVDGVRAEARGGMGYLGAEGTEGVNTDPSWTLAHRIHSHYDIFVNNQGVKMPFRVFYSGTSAQGDVMETWLPVYVGGVEQQAKKWYQVNATAPSSPINSKHKWYWAEWYDSLHGNNRIVFTYGSDHVGSYTGGFAPVVSTTPTTITTSGTWLSKGFINSPEGINTIVVNVSGVPTEIPLASGDFSTNTITVASTAGIAIDDIAFQAFNSDQIVNQTIPTGMVADVCSTINNQVYYIDWRQRNVLVSWDRNQNSYQSNIVYQGSSGLNDAVFTGTFTDSQTDVIQVIIDGIAQNTDTYNGTGPNDGAFITTGYSASGTNSYKVTVIADFGITFIGAPSGSWNIGETIIGSTSQAVATIVFTDAATHQDPTVRMISGSFQAGETVTGQSSGTTGTIATCGYQTWVQTFKNGSPFVPAGFAPSDVGYDFSPGINNLIDGITFQVGNQTGGVWNTHPTGDTWELTIGSIDTFAWSLNGTNQANHIPTSLSPISLIDGISVNWIKTTGHAIGDNWTVTEYPQITRGWRQVYYTKPTRLAGEGFLIVLDSNGWTMQPQQSSMYINGQGGEYYDVTVKDLASLGNQTLSCQRLKTDPQKKALFPYLMVSEPNYLSIVSSEKTWDILGQQKFLQLPQSKTFSDQVRVDFTNADWTNSEQAYIDRKQWFVLPEEGAVFAYDDFMKFWQPPQVPGRRIGSICVIDGQICGHSYERNETYTLFVPELLNDLGLYDKNVRMVLSYYDFQKRFNKKTITAVAFDGYVEGSPEIYWQVNGGLGGCEFKETGKFNPLMCIPTDTASLGKSQYGFHGLGNSFNPIIPHFSYAETIDQKNYYLRNIEIWSRSMEQKWSITAIGETIGQNLVSNSDIFNK